MWPVSFDERYDPRHMVILSCPRLYTIHYSLLICGMQQQSQPFHALPVGPGRVYPPLTALRWNSTLGKPDPHLPFASLLIHSFFWFLSSLFVCQSPPLQVYLSIIPKKPLCCLFVPAIYISMINAGYFQGSYASIHSKQHLNPCSNSAQNTHA